MSKVESQESEIIQELEEKVKQYESLLEEALAEGKKVVKKVEAGPFEDEGKVYYRVDGDLLMVSNEPLFGEELPAVLEKNMEVIVLNGLILCVVPKELQLVKEPLEFKLLDWSEIGGLASQIDNIRQAVELPINNAKLAAELGIPDFKGLLLHGKPGCGKTLIAKAIASMILNSTSVEPDAFAYIKGAEILSKFVGETEGKIASIFKNSRDYTKRTGKRGIIFIDEAEAILSPRGSGISSDVNNTIVPTFLSEMDGFDEHSPIMILATNLPNNIDEAILREGRIDLKIQIKRPDPNDALDILNIHIDKMKTCDNKADLVTKARDMIYSLPCKSKVSGAMLATVCQTAGRKALSRIVTGGKAEAKRKGITIQDIEESVNLINSSYAKV